MLVLSTRIVLDCFYLLIFYSEKFSTDVRRLPYAVNVNLNLSSTSILRHNFFPHQSEDLDYGNFTKTSWQPAANR